jgi:ABC-type proline/glycine betaine transport system ATPase subunit
LLDDLGALLKETATTTVFVTHDLPEAAQLASRVAVIIGNRLRQVGAPESVFASPADEEVAGFVNHKARQADV